MKEMIQTIPVNEAFDSGDECPFCYLEREVEQRAIRYVLGAGASYMETDVRAATDEAGFCRAHYQKMYDYGNALGSALMMQTYYARMMEELGRQLDDFEMPEKRPLLPIRKPREGKLPLVEWLQKKESTCYICSRRNDDLAWERDERRLHRHQDGNCGVVHMFSVPFLYMFNDRWISRDRCFMYFTIY